MQTVEWRQVVNKISQIQRDYRISTDKLTAHDIANRIMRKENYIIALLNKNLLNIHVPPVIKAVLGDTNWMLTKSLEWNISYCVLSYVFDESRTIRKCFLRAGRRNLLAEGYIPDALIHVNLLTQPTCRLRRRFIIMGALNLVFAPFIFVFILVFNIFQLGTEIHKNPTHIGKRIYTPYARWLFREFNELTHYYEKRYGKKKMKRCMNLIENL